MRKLTFVDIQGDGSHSNANHALGMIEELDGFCVQGKVIGVLKQKMDPKVINPQDSHIPNLPEICQTVINEEKNDVTMMGSEEARGEKRVHRMSRSFLVWPITFSSMRRYFQAHFFIYKTW